MASDFTFHQLRSFVAVAEELSFRRAADRLQVTQPPLSRQIQTLEASLGVTLFRREGRRVTLTEAGGIFLTEARGLVEAAGRAQRLAQDAHLGRAGTVRVGYTEPTALDLLPHVLARFRQAAPGVDLELHEMHSFESVRQLEEHRIDLAYLRPPVESGQIEVTMLHPDPLIAVLPTGHRLGPEPIRLDDLRDEAFVTYAAALGSGITGATLQACGAAGFSPRVARHATSTPMLMSLVAGGAGVGLVAHQFALIPYVGVKFVPLLDKRAESFVAVAVRTTEALASVQALRTVSIDVSAELFDSPRDAITPA
jgi:DNA-binding transcriptional LysR family regulator